MPKQMFYNIPVEKQQMFIEAAMEEFTTKSFELVSVNSIIKKANISRGSFYTYFTDLDELFNYIFETVKTERLQ
ncbi:MAG: TetR/AcrR family transcriptional regulator, partial [Firmicutes bacterium]|nr:TetR/AcrR family transcriptional regulator [Bacillota bacterium]